MLSYRSMPNGLILLLELSCDCARLNQQEHLYKNGGHSKEKRNTPCCTTVNGGQRLKSTH